MRDRPEHRPRGDPCLLCGRLAMRHRSPRAPGRDKRTNRLDLRTSRARERTHRERKWDLEKELFIGLDGEGQGRNPHRYVYLAAVDEHGHVHGEAENRSGLTTLECLELIINLPGHRVFGFALGYDYTMILRDLPDYKLFRLFHEGLRLTKGAKRNYFTPEAYGGFLLNYLNKKLTVRRCRWQCPTCGPTQGEYVNPPKTCKVHKDRHGLPMKFRNVGYGKTMAVWDIFRFFACKFTEALITWRIASKDKLEEMGLMKDQRANFDKLSFERVKNYCQEECMYMGQLVRALVTAHEDIGLHLKSFFGAGSTASALLDLFNIKESLQEPPEEMVHAVACGFFGGRFEISHWGPVEQKVYNYDISSAYPYQTTHLPCLVHGRWEHVKTPRQDRLLRSVREGQLALVRCEPLGSEQEAWGPLPWRHRDGTILFPLASGGVWAWKLEALAAVESGRFRIRTPEAWVYRTDCDCRPFGRVPEYYIERTKLGKDAKGLVIKLGLNSLYGKMAQSKGQAKFRSYVYAGNITSGTRAQLLEAVLSARDPWNVLMVATDGVFATEPLELPVPLDTGTAETGKPLGGWEKTELERGLFLCRPGIYFPMKPTGEDIKKVKARGISRGVLLDHADRLVEWWKATPAEKRATDEYTYSGLVRFIGAKAGITQKGLRRGEYGQWVEVPLKQSFSPLPKRRGALLDKLLPWQKVVSESSPYKPGLQGPEGEELKAAENIMWDQPDGDIVEAGLE